MGLRTGREDTSSDPAKMTDADRCHQALWLLEDGNFNHDVSKMT